MKTQTPPNVIYLKDYKVPDFLIDQVRLEVDIRADETLVCCEIFVRRNLQGQPCANLVLNGNKLTLIAVFIDGQLLDQSRYVQSQEALTLLDMPATFTLKTIVKILPLQNTSLEGLYVSNGMYCTQCEPEGFRNITYYLDRPDVMAKFTTKITANKQHYPVLLSNGNLIEKGDNSDGTHWVIWQDPFKKPCYLFALVAGDLAYREDFFITQSQRRVTLQVFVEAHDVDKVDHALDSLKRSMAWDEQVYGLEYDLDIYMIVAVSHFNMGAMENKGLNIFNTSCVLANPKTTTDGSFARVEGVIAHEYFHNWSGNRVTCRDWFQLSLKEGFTVFRDQSFSEDMGSAAVKRIEEIRLLRTHQFAEDAGPLSHPVRPESYIEINNFYTRTVYEKGAEVVRMIATLVGKEGFRKGCDLFFQKHDGEAITTEDFVACQSQANNIDLNQFERWYHQAGTPEITVQDDYDEQEGIYRLTLTQYCPPSTGGAAKPKLPFHMPVRLGLIDPVQGELPLFSLDKSNISWMSSTRKECVLSFNHNAQTWAFYDVPVRPVPSLFRNFSAPVKVFYPYQPQALFCLMTQDSDPFNRWDAMQQLMMQSIDQGMALFKEGKFLTVSPILIRAFSEILSDLPDDKSFASLLLALPSEAYIAEKVEIIDVETIVLSLKGIKQIIARELYPLFLKTYQTMHAGAAKQYFLSGEAIGKRSLQNLCLDYLLAVESVEARDLATLQFMTADNMTDEIAAFRGIIHASEGEVRDKLLDAFYHKWQKEALVMDLWFATQATSPQADCLAQVKGLEKHPAFELTNPNKVRALVGVFAGQNMHRFHAVDGSGYQYLADKIIELNTINPQIASRMVTPLTRWRRYSDHTQQKMKQALEKIMACEALCADVYEMVSKSLKSA